jgi:hypothetical protein
MKNNKFFLAAIVGSVVFFLLGYLTFGILLKDFLDNNSGLTKDVLEKFHKPMDQINWYAMVLSHLAAGFLFATIALWANARTLGAGARVGAVIGFLLTVHMNCLYYGVSNMYTLNSLIVETLAVTVIITIMTAVIAMILGKGKTTN